MIQIENQITDKLSNFSSLVNCVNPFLKWAGGKRWLIKAGIPTPPSYNRLIEPFVGGAAVFFALAPSKAVLSDVNSELINLYQVIRDRTSEFEKAIRWHADRHSLGHYYHIRSCSLESAVERAARTLYLNRTCWNGLYRVNQKGQFNVPIGTKNTVIFDGESFQLYARVLRAAALICQDFEVAIDNANQEDFLFVDPPYTVQHNFNGFVKYNEKMFSWDDQVRLAESLRRARKRGVKIVVTNADHHSLRALYGDDFNYRSVSRHSVLAGQATGRGLTTEALFTANV